MPLERLSIAHDTNHFYSAFSLSLLLPLLKKDELLDEAADGLFGRVTNKESRELVKELESYTPTQFPCSLTKLINTKLRPRLADYMQQHRDDFSHVFETEESFANGITAIREGAYFLGKVEIKALAHMMALCIRIHGPWFPEGDYREFMPPVVTESLVELTTFDGHYQSLIDPSSLPNEVRTRLFSSAIMQTPESFEAVDSMSLKRTELKRILKHNLEEISKHLAQIAHEVQGAPFKENDLNLPIPTDLRGWLRFDSLRELHQVRSEMSAVTLSSAYDLCLLSASDGRFDANRIYVDIKADYFDYWLRKDASTVKQARIEFKTLKHSFEQTITLDQLSQCLPDIVQIVEDRSHALVTHKTIPDSLSWPVALTVGAGAGLATMGIISIIGELGVGTGVGLASILPLGLPSAVLIITALGVHTFGSGFAVEYKKALEDVSQLLSEHRFMDAAERLDIEFERNIIVKGVRSFYLSNQHCALAHFFRAVCAEQCGEEKKAYLQYQEASKKAVEGTENSVTFFIAQLQLIKLLKNTAADKLPAGVKPEEKINTILDNLSKNECYKKGLASTYVQYHQSIEGVARLFLSSKPFNETDIQCVNNALEADGTYVLKHFSNGLGSFMHVFHTFFHGSVLAYINDVNPSYLKHETKLSLIKSLHGNKQAEKSIHKLAIDKLTQCAQLLHEFKKDYPELILTNQTIKSSIKAIFDFITHFQVLSTEEQRYAELGSDLAKILNEDPRQIATSIAHIEASLEFMMGLRRDFRVSYECIEDWLDALMTEPSIYERVSPNTGDTMLHKLVTLPISQSHLTSKIHEVAQHLSRFAAVLNRNDQTPQQALREHDPFRLEQVIYKDTASVDAHYVEDLSPLEQDAAKKQAALIQYHQLVSQKSGSSVNKELDKLLRSPELSALLLTHLGALLHNASSGMKRDYDRAKYCFERAAEQNQAIAYYNLGLMHEYGYGVPKNKVAAARYYHLSEQNQNAHALEAFNRLLSGSDLIASDLNKIASAYHHPSTEVKNGITGDYKKAMALYEQAAEKGGSNAYYNLGLMFFKAQGVDKNFVTAARYFQLAKDKGDATAHIKLTVILNSKEVTAALLNKIAELYVHGTDGIKVNYQEAIRFYEQAGERGLPLAFRTVATFYEQGAVGLNRNIITAAEFCRKALKHGDNRIEIQIIHDRLMGSPPNLLPRDQKKRLSKLFEQEWIAACSKQSDYPNTLDSNKKTLLHRVSERKHLKHCARLFLFGANQAIVDKSKRNPLYYLNQAEKNRVTHLQEQLSALTENLNHEPWVILARVVHVTGARPNLQKTEKALHDLYQIKLIKPLMDLAHLAALGLHDLSNRTKFSQIDYDSDDDDNETINEAKQCLSIQFDANNETVENLCHIGMTGVELENARGVYAHKNTVYVGGAFKSAIKQSVMIHELTHFLALEVFKNFCNPYAQNDRVNKERFASIEAQLLIERPHHMVGQVFMAYPIEQWAAELIVRVPQMIVEYPHYTEKELAEYLSPGLWAYYNDVFLPAVVQHTKTLKSRALSHWDEALFQQQTSFNPLR